VTQKNTTPATNSISRFLDLIWRPGEVREIRIPKHNKFGHTASGYFDNPIALASAAARWDGRANLYITLNPVNPALLARASNRILDKAESTSSDTDVTRRRWLFIDFDPARPAGISSTEAERQAAREVLDQVASFLSSMGWPEGITAMSGNGWYLLYAIDLPNDAPSLELVKGVLEALASRFNSDAVHIDTTVCNAARLAGLIGSLKVKGDSLPDRPHRRSTIEFLPERLVPVQEDLLAAVAGEKPSGKEVAPRIDSTWPRHPVDLEAVLQERGIEYKVQPPDAQGITWYHVRSCPFHEDECHPFECGVGQKLPDGPLAGKCFHAEEGSGSWQEWKKVLGITFSRNGHHQTSDTCPGTDDPQAGTDNELHLTDTWNAHRLVTLNQQDILWCEVFKHWFVYDGARYVKDVTREVERRAERVVKGLYGYAASFPDKERRQTVASWALQSESRFRMGSMVESAKRMAPVHPNEFDQDPMLFNVRNGTVDLRSQSLLPHQRDHRLTKLASVVYDPSATCPLWLAFLYRIFSDNQEIIGFVRRLFGYGLTGLLTDHIVVILYGTGANGKSTLLGVLRTLAGDYAHHCRPEVFTAKRGESQGFELVPLAGARVVTASETSAGKRLDEALVKEMTGGEPISCAPKYGDFFTFQPVFKPLLATNHKPQVRGVDEGIWRRLILLHFTVTIPEEERDRGLPAKLHQELPGILNWALAGVREFLQSGLAIPEEVRAATQDYRSEQDILGGWIEDHCVVKAEVADEYSALYEDYAAWCGANNEEPISKTRFSASVDERGCVTHRGAKGKRLRRGIARRAVVGDG
jgi:P4 family phage/plasmid primase-like protien